MSAHPGRWELLRLPSDPWPGSTEHVSSAAEEYRSLATSIRSQVSQLRSMAAGQNQLVGAYAPELRDSSDDLADYLERAEGRFDTVATELTRWEPELVTAQTRSRAMLREAENLDQVIRTHQAPSTPVDAANQTAVDAESTRAHALSGAQHDLEALVVSFTRFRDDVDAVSSSIAGRIREASHDSLKNHRFDGVRKWVHDHADLLKSIADVLTFIATAIVIAALIIGTGGLALAALLTLGALLVHSLLALNGDGSWADVALDAFALATFGVGRVLTTGARGALALREGGAAFQELSAGARTAFAEASGIQKAVVWVTRSNPVFRSIAGFAASMSKFGEVMNAEFKGGLGLRLVYGDKEAAGLAKMIAESADRLGPGRLLNGAQHLMDLSVPVWRSAFGTDLVFKGLNDASPFVFDWHGLEPWVDWKEGHTVHDGFVAAP